MEIDSDGQTSCSVSLAVKCWHIQGGPKNALFSRVDNFATVNGRTACDMSKVSEFCLEIYTTCMSVHLYICLICINIHCT